MGADGDYPGLRAQIPAYTALAEPPLDRLAAWHAAHALSVRSPFRSAEETLRAGQARHLRRLGAVAGIAGLCWPDLLFLGGAAVSLLWLITALLFRAGLCMLGRAMNAGPQHYPAESAARLPVYTLLIALKDEAAVLPQLAAAIRKLNYPAGLLDVKLLIEAGDTTTRRAALSQRWPGRAELLIVPPGAPRTKPRALNYGLARARGEFVVVYDAEDRPHPDQLLAAVSCFRASGARLACVQAPLVGEGGRGWLASQWALEYALQFGCLMRGLSALGLPVALGGTSNHFRRRALEAAGGWDPWNVTEDADLGLRLARCGARVGMIAPPTLEAPPERLGVWTAQRSRWLKGYLQTWLVLMRQPRRACRELGVAGFASVQLTLGAAILSALLHGPWTIWLLLMLALPVLQPPPVFIAIAAAGYLTGFLLALLAPGGSRIGRFLLALTQPLYLPLQSIAMMRAIYGLLRQPHFWAKTPHSVSRVRRDVSESKRSAHVPAFRAPAGRASF